MISRPLAPKSAVDLTEMQILRPSLRPNESETWAMHLSILMHAEGSCSPKARKIAMLKLRMDISFS